MRLTGSLLCILLMHFISASPMITPHSRVKNIFAPVLYIPKPLPVPGYSFGLQNAEKVRRACLQNEECRSAKGFRGNQLGYMIPMQHLKTIRMIPDIKSTEFNPKYREPPRGQLQRSLVNIKRAKALRALQAIGSLSFSMAGKRSTNSKHQELDDLIPMSFSYKGKRGGGRDENDSQDDQDIDLPAKKKVHRRGNVDYLVEPSQDDLSSLGSISFSQVGKRSQQPQFEEVDNEEMENPVVYNELQDSEGYGHLQKRSNTDELEDLDSMSFIQLGKRSSKKDELDDLDSMSFSHPGKRSTDYLEDLDSMSFSHLGKRSNKDELDDLGSMSFSQLGKKKRSQTDDLDDLGSMSFSQLGKRKRSQTDELDDLGSMSFSQLGKRSDKDELDDLGSMSFSQLGKRSDKDELDDLGSMSFSQLGKRSQKDTIDDLDSMSFSHLGKRSQKEDSERELMRKMKSKGVYSLLKLQEMIDSQYDEFKQRENRGRSEEPVEFPSNLKPQLTKRNSVVGINQWG